MTSLTPCSNCGIHEPNETIVNGLCAECRKEASSAIVATAPSPKNPKTNKQKKAHSENKGNSSLSKVAKFLKWSLVIYWAAILIKIIIISFDGKIVRYSVMDLSIDNDFRKASWDGASPKLFPLNPTSYKFDGEKIISMTNGSISVMAAPNCQIWNLKNWSCTWDEPNDGYYFERMNNGQYYELLSSWSFEEAMTENEYNDIGEFAYNIAGCKRDFHSGVLNGLIFCPIRFAFIYN